MTSLSDILGQGDAAGYAIPPGWMQGRTAYGGLSTAIAHDHVRRTVPDLPPLRSAMVAFVGPIAGTVTVDARILRRGRNAVFVAVELASEAGLGLSATLLFVAARASAIAQPPAPAPSAPPATGATGTFGPTGFFLQNFELLGDQAGDRVAWLRWIRLRDRAGLDPMNELLAIGDALPPAAMRLADARMPISSMSWQCNLLTDRPETDDGWWLVESESDAALNGCSSQRMAVWNSRGERVASGMQSVALFA